MMRCAAVVVGLLATMAAIAQPRTEASAQDADARARAVESQMTDAERTHLTHGIMALPFGPIPAGVPLGAGYVRGVDRLSFPPLTETDASLGVSYVGGLRKDGATALPSGLAMGATWSPALMRSFV